MVGGLLVTVAAVGVFAAYAGATGDPGRSYVVVSRDLPAGHHITGSDLRLERAALPDPEATRAFTSASQLDGAVTLAPLGADELVQRSAVLTADVTDADTSLSSQEFSFAIEVERALNGDVHRGESVQVLATYGTGTDAFTTVVARRASVVDASSTGRATIGTGGRVVLTLALESRQEVIAVAHASQVAAVTLVRTTRDDAGADPPDTYKAIPPPEAEARRQGR